MFCYCVIAKPFRALEIHNVESYLKANCLVIARLRRSRGNP
ncbi:hypothetical protein [Helicobacter rodentium]|nr:hypothetical protein [Helicobacter rodentium]